MQNLKEPKKPQESVSTEQLSQQNNSVKTLSSAPRNYQMRIRQSCFCPQELLGPFDIEVRNGKAISIIRVSDQQPVPLEYYGNQIPSLELALNYIAEASSKKVYRQEISWWHKPYVPKLVKIDYSQYIADEEVHIEIENFKLMPQSK